jgi:hypothetical protein
MSVGLRQTESPRGFGLRQPSGALCECPTGAKAAEGCRSPRRWRAGRSAGLLAMRSDVKDFGF